jgi:hypothetical protein
MGSKPTRSSINDNLNSIVSNTYLNFTVKCQLDAKLPQSVIVDPGPVQFLGNFQTNDGCTACQQAINMALLAQYEQTRGLYFPDTEEGDALKIAQYRTLVCGVVCSDVFLTDISQESHLQYTSSCKITAETLSSFQQQVTANIMQSLTSNADFFAAVADSFGRGRTSLEVRNEIHSRITQNLTLNVTNDMDTTINGNQEFRLRPSNSVFSAGISQQMLLDITKTVLVKNNFANKVFQGTTIDQHTTVVNDENTLAAFLAAIEQINAAFANAFSTNVTLTAVFFGMLVVAGLVFLLALILQARADAMKRELKALCPDSATAPETKSVKLVAGSLTIGGKAKELAVEVPSVLI